MKYVYPLSYQGNVVWPILFLFIFPPVAIILLILNLNFKKDGVVYRLHYRGDKFWLIFWTILIFPVAIALGFLNGFDVVGE